MASKKLLVVDDEPDFASFVRDVGLSIGYEVRVAHDGEEAKTIWSSFDPDIIVLDVIMPKVDGVEFVRWLGEQHCRAKLIVVSGYNPRYADLTSRMAGDEGMIPISVLQKPLRLADLKTALQA